MTLAESNKLSRDRAMIEGAQLAALQIVKAMVAVTEQGQSAQIEAAMAVVQRLIGDGDRRLN